MTLIFVLSNIVVFSLSSFASPSARDGVVSALVINHNGALKTVTAQTVEKEFGVTSVIANELKAMDPCFTGKAKEVYDKIVSAILEDGAQTCKIGIGTNQIMVGPCTAEFGTENLGSAKILRCKD